MANWEEEPEDSEAAQAGGASAVAPAVGDLEDDGDEPPLPIASPAGALTAASGAAVATPSAFNWGSDASLETQGADWTHTVQPTPVQPAPTATTGSTWTPAPASPVPSSSPSTPTTMRMPRVAADEDQSYKEPTPLFAKLVHFFGLDEHGKMSRHVAAQVGVACLLLLVQFLIDLFAWTMAFRWVFVPVTDDLAWTSVVAGWLAAGAFGLAMAAVVLLFDRMLIATPVNAGFWSYLKPGFLVRVAIAMAFSAIVAIPIELMAMNDLIQADFSGKRTELMNDGIARAREECKADVKAGVAVAATGAEDKAGTALLTTQTKCDAEREETAQDDARSKFAEWSKKAVKGTICPADILSVAPSRESVNSLTARQKESAALTAALASERQRLEQKLADDTATEADRNRLRKLPGMVERQSKQTKLLASCVDHAVEGIRLQDNEVKASEFLKQAKESCKANEVQRQRVLLGDVSSKQSNRQNKTDRALDRCQMFVPHKKVLMLENQKDTLHGGKPSRTGRSLPELQRAEQQRLEPIELAKWRGRMNDRVAAGQPLNLVDDPTPVGAEMDVIPWELLRPDELGTVLGKPLTPPQGLSARIETLERLSKDANVNAIKWGIRLLFTALALLVVIAKLFFSEATRQYFRFGKDPIMGDDHRPGDFTF